MIQIFLMRQLMSGDGKFLVHWRIPEATPLVFVVVCIVALFFVLLVVALEILRRRRDIEKATAVQWDAFELTAAQKGLTGSELDLLREIHAEQSGEIAPVALLRLASVYDRAIDDWIDGLNKDGEGPTIAQWENLARIRSCLGFNTLSFETRLSHTRQIPVGQVLRVWSVRNDSVTNCVVSLNTETEFVLEWKDNPLDVLVGGALNFSFSRQSDGEYRAEVGLLRLESGKVHCTHTARLNRQQLRMWVRVPVYLDGCVYRLVAPDGQALPVDRLEVRLMDLSGGGAMIASPMIIPVETRGLMEFDLGEYKLFDVPFLLLRHGRPDANGWQIGHLCFDGVETSTQEKIMRFVFERQRIGQVKVA
jgi:PilZ domain